MFKQSSQSVNIRELMIFDGHLQNSFRFQVRYFKTHSKSPFKLPNLNMFFIFCLSEIIRHQTADQMKIVRILNKSKETQVFSLSPALQRADRLLENMQFDVFDVRTRLHAVFPLCFSLSSSEERPLSQHVTASYYSPLQCRCWKHPSARPQPSPGPVRG